MLGTDFYGNIKWWPIIIANRDPGSIDDFYIIEFLITVSHR